MTNTQLINETITETKRFLHYLYVEKRRVKPNTEIIEIKRNSEYQTAKEDENLCPEKYYHMQHLEKACQIVKIADTYTVEVTGFRPTFKVDRCKWDKLETPIIKARYGNGNTIAEIKPLYLKLCADIINSEHEQGVLIF